MVSPYFGVGRGMWGRVSDPPVIHRWHAGDWYLCVWPWRKRATSHPRTGGRGGPPLHQDCNRSCWRSLPRKYGDTILNSVRMTC